VSLGCYPGSFNPPTVAHLAIVDGILERGMVERVDLVLSRVALGKEDVDRPLFEDRIAVVSAVTAARPGVRVVATDLQLLTDIAQGYDLLVVGADKWAQVLDPRFYGGSTTSRDRAVAGLPPLLVVSRPGYKLTDLPPHATLLDLPATVASASSTAARSSEMSWMATEAAAFDTLTGAWSDPDRYDRWRRARS